MPTHVVKRVTTERMPLGWGVAGEQLFGAEAGAAEDAITRLFTQVPARAQLRYSSCRRVTCACSASSNLVTWQLELSRDTSCHVTRAVT